MLSIYVTEAKILKSFHALYFRVTLKMHLVYSSYTRFAVSLSNHDITVRQSNTL